MESSLDLIRQRCELCQTLDCCPEHCCDWDSCKCRTCQGCLARRKEPVSSSISEQGNPQILIKATGTEEVKRLKKDEAQLLKTDDEKSSQHLARAQEQIRASDGALIINYEVPIEEDEKVVYAGGIKGIRALRYQRDQINDQLADDLNRNNAARTNYQRHDFEESKR